MKKLITPAIVMVGLLTTSSVFAADAKENWDQLCAKCHGVDGAGNTKMGKKLKVKD